MSIGTGLFRIATMRVLFHLVAAMLMLFLSKYPVSSSESRKEMLLGLETRKTLKVCTVGFSTPRSDRLLLSLLDDPEVVLPAVPAREVDGETEAGLSNEVPARILELGKDMPLIATSMYTPLDEIPSDAAFLFLDAAHLHDENDVLLRLQRCFQSLSGPEMKKPFFIIFSGSALVAGQIESLLKDAWLLWVAEEETGGERERENLFARLNIQIILSPYALKEGESVNPDAKVSISTALAAVTASAKPLHDCFPRGVTEAPRESASSSPSSTDWPAWADVETEKDTDSENHLIGKRHSIGMEAAQDGVEEAVQWAVQVANESIEKLNARFEQPEDFARFVTKLLHSADSLLVEHFDAHMREGEEGLSAAPTAAGEMPTSSGSNSSGGRSAALALARKDLSRQLFGRLLPIFKRQVQLLRMEVGAEFNAQVGEEELPVTVHVMLDLQDAASAALRSFSARAARLIPPGAPRASWTAGFERFELQQTLEEYLQSREASYRAMGVLPRGGLRPQVALSVHALVAHPLGFRDYRQDPLRDHRRSADALLYDPQLATAEIAGAGKDVAGSPGAAKESETVAPGLARRALVRQATELQAQSSSPAWLQALGLGSGSRGLKQCRERGEWAREMLMFPLSVKNPEVPMAGGGRRRRAGPPSRDPDQDTLGPER